MLSKQTGISLIESMIGVAVLAIGIIAVVQFKTTFMYYNSNAKAQVTATILAQNRLEDLRNFQTIQRTRGLKAYDDIQSGHETIKTQNTVFKLTWQVKTYTDPSYKLVEISNSWKDRHNKTQEIQLTSIIGKLDPTQAGRLQLSQTQEHLIP